jgi:hypothetical protein
MAISVSGPCNQFSPNTSYLVTLDGVNGRQSTIVSGSNVETTVQAMKQAYYQSLQQAQQSQPQVICIQQPNQEQAQNNSSPFWNFVGLISGAFLAISALRSPHMEIGIEHIGSFFRESASNAIKNTREGLDYIRKSLVNPAEPNSQVAVPAAV